MKEVLGCGCVVHLGEAQVWEPCHRHWHILILMKQQEMELRKPDNAALHG